MALYDTTSQANMAMQGLAAANAANQSKNHSVAPSGHDVSVDNLYPAIIQCFVIILAGYIAGRTSLISSNQGKGIGTFVSNFCLPALLFKSMAELQFHKVNWMFLLGIGISKTVVFVVVVLVTLLVKRPVNLGYAGLFGIFATQSNDFALGYPILQALYGETHPEYLQYIYLVAPISLILLNPIGFTMMEISRRKNDTKSPPRSKASVVFHIAKDVLTNPIVFMAIIGVVGNFVFKQKIPSAIDDILSVLGNAFSASALFYLGLSLVGKMTSQLGLKLVAPMLLIAAKTMLLPLITWQVVGALELRQSNDSRSLNMYAFLYGTFPTAPSVFLYASHFSIAQDIMATGMVACTFLSAPLMFVSAKMMTVVVNSEMDYKSLLQGTSFDFSIMSLICNVWIFLVLVLSRKYKRMPHQLLLCLVFAQTISCVGMLLYDGMDTNVVWQHYAQFVMLLVGTFSTRCFAAMISLTLYFLHCRSLCFVLRMKAWMFFFGLGFPAVCTGLLLIFGGQHMHNEIDPSFHYGIDQTILSVIILGACSVINITFLILRQRNTRIPQQRPVKVRRRFSRRIINEDEESARDPLLSDDDDDDADVSPRRRRANSAVKLLGDSEAGGGDTVYKTCSTCAGDCHDESYNEKASNIEDIVPFPKEHTCSKTDIATSDGSSSPSSTDSLFGNDLIDERQCRAGICNYQQRQQCSGLLRCYQATYNTMQDADDEVQVRRPKMKLKDEYQTDRFIILLLFLQLSMFVGLFLCTWRLFNHRTSGIYVEIEFLDGFFNYGQSLVVLAIFGFDTKYILLPCIKRINCWWQRFMYGTEVVTMPSAEEIPRDVQLLCEQFVKHHMANCKRDIVRDRKYRFRTYSKVFCGSVLCDWLTEVGLCADREAAVRYGRTLLIGQVVGHVTSEHNFQDMPYFYRFLDDEDEGATGGAT